MVPQRSSGYYGEPRIDRAACLAPSRSSKVAGDAMRIVAALLGVSLMTATCDMARAADAPDGTPSLDTSLLNSRIYVQLLGGAALANTVRYYFPNTNIALEPDATKIGSAWAASAGVVVVDGLSIEADILTTHRDQDGGTSHYQTTSLMADAKYNAALGDMFGIYAAVGTGVIWYGVTDPFGGNNLTSGLGYQVILGADAKISANFSLVGEVRFQDTFNANFATPANVDIRMPTTAVLAGAKLSF